MKKRQVNADLHNHLATRRDLSHLEFDIVIDTIRERLGPGGIFGVCNFDDNRYEQFVGKQGYERENMGNAIYVPEKDIWVVKGQEVHSKDGSVLVLGLNEGKALKSGRPLEDTIKESKDHKGINVMVHPFHIAGLGRYFEYNFRKYNETPLMQTIYFELFRKFDGIEIHNSEAALSLFPITPLNPNEKARELFRMMRYFHTKLGTVISSDGHSVWEIGTSYMTVDFPERGYVNSDHWVRKFLRDAVREHRNEDGQMNNCRLGAFLHGLAAYGYYPILNRIKKEKQ